MLLATLIGPDGEIREHLPLAEAPKSLVAAIVAAEDGDFYDHGGVNLKSALRAAWANWRGGGYGQGASTLTMQVVRNLTERKEKTLGRKIGEALLAVQLERRIGKDGVLQMYLDAPYLGQNGNLSVCGFRAAAKHYWGIDATELDVAQAATLAAILPAPGGSPPIAIPATAKEQARSRAAPHAGARLARARDRRRRSRSRSQRRPHDLPPERVVPYVQATRAWLEEHLDPAVVYGAGLEVYTALDLVAQARTEKIATERVPYLERVLGRPKEPALETALPLLDANTGALVAVYGGTMASSTDFDRATQAYRQAGSSFKPLVYALAFDTKGPDGAPGFTAADAMPNCAAQLRRHGRLAPAQRRRRVHVDGEPRVRPRVEPEHRDGVAPREGGRAEAAHRSLGEARVRHAELSQRDGARARPGRGPPDRHGAVREHDRARRSRREREPRACRQGSVGCGAPLPARRRAGAVAGIGAPHARAHAPRDRRGHRRRESRRGRIRRLHGRRVRQDGHDRQREGPLVHRLDARATPARSGSATTNRSASARPRRILASPLWGWWMHDLHEGYGQPKFADDDAVTHRAICTISGGRPHAGCSLIYAPFLPGTEPKKSCTLVHEHAEEVLDEEGNPVLKKHESLWKKKAREEEEKTGRGSGRDRASDAVDSPASPP